MRMGSGLSGHPDAVLAASQACGRCAEDLGVGSVDLALVFFTSHHVAEAGRLAEVVRRELRPECMLGVSAESVLGGHSELERTPGVSVLAARLPGVSLGVFTSDNLMPYEDGTPEGAARFARAFGVDEEHRATLIFADPFSMPLINLLPAMNRACAQAAAGTLGATGEGRHAPVGPIVGGLASAGGASGGAGSNVLLLDGTIRRSGAVGVSLRGHVRVEAMVSQGCRPFGPSFVVTGAKRNIVTALAGRPALDGLREAIESLPEEQRGLLAKGLFLGRVINEYKDHFGRDDFLIRNVVAVDEGHGAVVVADLMRVGQTVRFHMRDAVTAQEDLALLLDAQQLKDPPAGAMMVTCNGRGTRLFGRPHHDAAAVQRAFRPGRSGEDLAKGGQPIDSDAPMLPLAGFFAAGEIGPIGEVSFLHGQTACLALFRSAE